MTDDPTRYLREPRTTTVFDEHWRKLDDFSWAAARLSAILQPLMEQMQQSGLALEQEAVWLPV
jgi:hypothetical protein